MKTFFSVLCATLLALLCSCATARPPQTFQDTNPSVLVIVSLDGHSSQVTSPVRLGRMENSQLLEQLKGSARRQIAVVILEDYAELEPGVQFRDRSFAWFLGLRGLGYQHIVFLRGKGVSDPTGLPILAEYF